MSGLELDDRFLGEIVCSMKSQGLRSQICSQFLGGSLLLVMWWTREWKWSRSVVSNSATPWTVAHQAPPSPGFSRQEYWSGLSFPSPGDLPDPGIEPRSPALQADALTSEPPGKPLSCGDTVPISGGGGSSFSKILYCYHAENFHNDVKVRDDCGVRRWDPWRCVMHRCPHLGLKHVPDAILPICYQTKVHVPNSQWGHIETLEFGAENDFFFARPCNETCGSSSLQTPQRNIFKGKVREGHGWLLQTSWCWNLCSCSCPGRSGYNFL